MTAPPPSTLTLNDCTISFRRHGKGESVLFLHGAGGSGGWLPFMDKLSKNFDLIVPEHPGFGASETPEWLDSIDDLAYFYLNFLDELKLTDVHLVGLSLGGWIAAELAVRNTSRLKSLTLVDSAGIYVKGVPQFDFFLCDDAERMRNTFHDQAIAEQQIKFLSDVADEDIVLKNRYTSAKLLWQPRAYNPNLVKWLHRIDVATLIIWGDKDRLFPLDYGETFQALIPGAQLRVIAECGHLPNIEKADEFCETLESFIGNMAT